MKPVVSLREVIRTGPPTIDQRGTLFELEGRIYRAFRGETAALYRKLLAADFLPELFGAGLVRFTEADIALEGSELVVEVERVPIVSYPPEWPTIMLRDAGVLIAQLGAALAHRGLGLHDAHPWNVLYDGTRPVFIDLGSVTEGSGITTSWMREFRRHIILPLALHRIGLHQLADAVQRTPHGGWTARLDRKAARPFPIGYWLLRRYARQPARFYAALATYVSGAPDRGARTPWSQYYESGGAEVGDTSLYDEKQRSVDAILAELPPGSVLDAGSNAGWYSRLAVARGHTVIALDTDDRTLGSLYLRARDASLPILALRMDMMWPTGSSGLGLESRAAPERLQSDTVMALALLHHLAGFQGITFEVFARVLDMFAKRYVIVEFIPREDRFVAHWAIAKAEWYDLESLKVAMSPYFSYRESRPSTPAPRQIVLFERDLAEL